MAIVLSIKKDQLQARSVPRKDAEIDASPNNGRAERSALPSTSSLAGFRGSRSRERQMIEGNGIHVSYPAQISGVGDEPARFKTEFHEHY
jgi:hypothetical protein